MINLTLTDDLVDISAPNFHQELKVDKEQYLKILSSGFRSVGRGLYPPGVRWISPSRNIFLIEESPKYRVISMELPNDKKEVKEYRLPFPYLIYAISIDPMGSRVLSVFARMAPLQSMDSPVYVFPIPNLYTDGKVCPATHQIERFPLDTSIIYRLSAVMDHFWGSHFNFEVTDIWQNRYFDHLRNFTSMTHDVASGLDETLTYWEKKVRLNDVLGYNFSNFYKITVMDVVGHLREMEETTMQALAQRAYAIVFNRILSQPKTELNKTL